MLRIMLRIIAALAVICISTIARSEQPNVLWIYVDDMSNWLQCNGDPIAITPNIDRLANEGVRFQNAFVPSPVCSTTRSAIVTGTMQTTHGLHQHRTMIKKPLPDSLLTVPELFRKAGYLTFNESKDDYNFLRSRDQMYSADFKRTGFKSHCKGRDFSWLEQLRGKKFFGQIQLAGGKFGGETGNKYPAESRFDPTSMIVPPQYPDHPVTRNAIARHYEQIVETDEQVGAIVTAMKEHGLWNNTVVFFFTDHGSPLPRSKQFLYEEGLNVPLIVRFPEKHKPAVDTVGTRVDLVNCIDLAATSLGLADISVPSTMESQDLFADDYQPQPYVIGARDRLGIAVDRIRSVRTKRFRYLRNFKTDRALYQPQYRQNYATFKTFRALNQSGKLTPLQASYHDPANRVGEELYDVDADPHQIKNLAFDPSFAEELKRHREILNRWIERTDDKGQYPESKESLIAVYDRAKGKVFAPEYDFLK